jgi:hypothetical protein
VCEGGINMTKLFYIHICKVENKTLKLLIKRVGSEGVTEGVNLIKDIIYMYGHTTMKTLIKLICADL